MARGEWLRMGELDFRVDGIFELLQDAGGKMHQCARGLLCCEMMILFCVMNERR